MARNVADLRDKKYSHLPTITDRNRALAEEMDSSLSQMQRLVAGTLGTSTDSIEQLADIFSVQPNQLLLPYFSNNISEEFYASKRDKEKARKPTSNYKGDDDERGRRK